MTGVIDLLVVLGGGIAFVIAVQHHILTTAPRTHMTHFPECKP